jgi:tRNA threonylcarbamoyl adenosine modification protein (Sua5/YciO/YrdC/YwlC family)
MGYYVKIHPDNPQQRQVDNVVGVLQNDGVAIIPTDTIYALAASSKSIKGMKKLAAMRNTKLERAAFSFIVNDFSQISEYTRQFDTPTYKLLKRALPGPYTFIMHAGPAVPKMFNSKKKTIGIRYPENNITRAITVGLDAPLAVTSLHINDRILEYPTDPELIYEENKHRVDVVIDGGVGRLDPSTIIDVTQGEPEVIREGSGPLDVLN